MSKETGGPAFPRPHSRDDRSDHFDPDYAQEGMTLRDYFAAKAMQSAIAGHIAHYGHERNYWPPEEISQYAMEVADAMLAERSK